jgi:hypothetical protein
MAFETVVLPNLGEQACQVDGRLPNLQIIQTVFNLFLAQVCAMEESACFCSQLFCFLSW